MKLRSIFIISLMFIYLCLFLGACKDNKQHSSASSMEKASWVIYYSPLTLEKCSRILSDTDSFGHCIIDYVDYHSDIKISLWLINEYSPLINAFSSIELFSGITSADDPTQTPPTYTDKRRDFSSTEVQEIFDYVLADGNRDYFFNNVEYTGLDIPYELMTDEHFCDIGSSGIMFTIQFYESENDERCWAIFKCVDEYPSPDSPLYGLFQMLENDFISQFE